MIKSSFKDKTRPRRGVSIYSRANTRPHEQLPRQQRMRITINNKQSSSIQGPNGNINCEKCFQMCCKLVMLSVLCAQRWYLSIYSTVGIHCLSQVKKPNTYNPWNVCVVLKRTMVSWNISGLEKVKPTGRNKNETEVCSPGRGSWKWEV